VARTDEFQELARNLAMHIAAEQPRYVSGDDIPSEEAEREQEIYRALAEKEGRPAAVIGRIVEGRMKKYCQEVCLLEQPYVRDDQKTVGELLREAVAKFGENILIRRFVRFQLGEQARRGRRRVAMAPHVSRSSARRALGTGPGAAHAGRSGVTARRPRCPSRATDG
jgi:elongation factor Ts